jgi:hypothetical protein
VEKTEKIVKESGMFFVSKKQPSTHHVYHAFHHDLTIKKPRSAPHFLQNTLKNTSKSNKTRARARVSFFSQK